MKKTILTIGLFTLVLAATSFAAPTVSTSSITDNLVIDYSGGNGGQDTGGNKKVDYSGGNGGQDTGGNKKVDYSGGNGGQDTGGNKKVD